MPTITLNTPPDFKFWPTAVSHGWCDLPPYRCDEDARTLERLLQLRNGTIVKLTMRADLFEPGQVPIRIEGLKGKPTREQADEIRRAVSRCLEIDRNLTSFYKLVRKHPDYRWVEKIGAGRMLASPTVWEDLVKTLMTTNTVWRMTIQMCERVNTLGDAYPGSGHAFPTPEQIAAMKLDDLNTHVRAGYRGAYLHELAQRIVNGEIEVESWRDADIPSLELYKRIKGLKGFGDYAAGNLLRLLGHFDRLATDSVCREVYAELNGGTPASDDKQIAAYYEPFGQWRGLVQWMDVMRDYFKSERFKQ